MKINSVKMTFQGGITAVEKLAEKAEKRLQKRLVSHKNLMYDNLTDTIYRISTGKKFSGKFGIKTDFLEQFFHIKDGKLYFTLVKGKDGSKKVGGFSVKRMRLWANNPSLEEKAQINLLSVKRDDVYDDMMQEFGTRQCIKNGTSTYIGSRGY